MDRSKLMTVGYSVLSLGLGGVLVWLVVERINLRDMWDSLSHINLLVLTLTLVPYLLAGAFRALRWDRLMKAREVSVRRLFFVEQTGLAVNSLSFFRVFDEVVRLGILSVRDGVASGKILASEAMQRTLEFGTLALLMGAGVIVLPELRQYWTWAGSGIAIAISALVLLFTVGPALSRLPWLNRLGFVKTFASSAEDMRSDWKLALYAFALSLLSALAVGVIGWLAILATGVSISWFAAVIVTHATRFFVSFVPGLPMGFGTFEFAAITLLGLWGVAASQAVAYSLALRISLFLPALVIGLGFLASEGLTSLRAIGSLRQRMAEQGSE